MIKRGTILNLYQPIKVYSHLYVSRNWNLLPCRPAPEASDWLLDWPLSTPAPDPWLYWHCRLWRTCKQFQSSDSVRYVLYGARSPRSTTDNRNWWRISRLRHLKESTLKQIKFKLKLTFQLYIEHFCSLDLFYSIL